jgi:hypothetical protein
VVVAVGATARVEAQQLPGERQRARVGVEHEARLRQRRGLRPDRGREVER